MGTNAPAPTQIGGGVGHPAKSGSRCRACRGEVAAKWKKFVVLVRIRTRTFGAPPRRCSTVPKPTVHTS